MGVVYRAEDTRLGRSVALKLLPEKVSGNAQALERFLREARAASSLNHPNILTIYDIGEHEGRHFIAMELLEGRTVGQRLAASGPFDIDSAIEITAGVADALDAAHKRGILHRDIKPGNIFITERGQAKILDFGLAKMTAPEVSTRDATAMETEALDLTQPGSAVGTISYMSPEQVRGEALDGRSDLFSLGVVLYEMTTGRQAFSGATSAVVFEAIMNRAPVSPVRLNPETPAELERIINKLLEKDRKLRYQSAAEVTADLARLRRDTQMSRSAAMAIPEPPPAATSGSTPEVARSDRVFGMIAMVFGMLIALIAILRPDLSSLFGSREPASPAARPPIDSIAVLPLVSQGGDEETGYLSDGVTEAVINSLSRLPDLRVMARNTVFRYKGDDRDPAVIGQELSVRAVMTGRLRQQGDRLAISAELVDVSDGTQLWGQQYNHPVEDIFETQEAIARAIADNLRRKLTGEQSARLGRHVTDSAEAYRLYLKGRHHWNKRTEEDVRKGLEYFQQAIDRDPTFAMAHVGVAESYQVSYGDYLGLDPIEASRRARAAAERALAIDDGLGEAYATLGGVEEVSWNWEKAEKQYLWAIELSPGYATAHQWYGEFLADSGRYQEALAATERARSLDPLSPIINAGLAFAYLAVGRPDDALGQADQTLELAPGFVPGLLARYATFRALGRDDDAMRTFIEMLRQVGVPPEELRSNEEAYRTGGWAAVGRLRLDWLQGLEKEGQTADSIEWAEGYTLAAEHDRAFEVLERAYQDRYPVLGSIRLNPFLLELHPDPRFQELLRRLGKPPLND